MAPLQRDIFGFVRSYSEVRTNRNVMHSDIDWVTTAFSEFCTFTFQLSYQYTAAYRAGNYHYYTLFWKYKWILH